MWARKDKKSEADKEIVKRKKNKKKAERKDNEREKESVGKQRWIQACQ